MSMTGSKGAIQVYAVSPYFQITSIVLVVFSLAAMFMYSEYFVKIKDGYEEVLPLTPQRALEFGGRPAEVQVGMAIRDFPFFDMSKGAFSIDVSVYFLFDPRLVSVDRIGDFLFKRAELLFRKDPVIKIIDEKLFVQYDLRLKFDVSLDYQDFPFDGHRINFVLYHPRLSPGEVVYTAVRNDFFINPDIETPGWSLIDRRVSTGYEEERLVVEAGAAAASFHPSAVFSLDFDRVGARHIMTIFVPLLLIFFVALLSLSLDPLSGTRSTMLSLAAASITALITYRFVIESMSPAVGYLLIVDYIFLVFLMFCCLVFLVTIFGARISARYKSFIAGLLQLAVVLTFAYFFFWV
ncbi:TPA: hypothetical protein DCW54_00985 [Candidatus Dependentiae bacterium]|nr:hypothetical protein [Candidatus Dependentiae bacterium]